MRWESANQVLLLSTCVLFLAGWAGAQSTQSTATSSGNENSSSVQQTEQQEMRDELKALRAEVERLRAEVELHRSSAPADDRGEAAPAPTGRPSLPPVTAANFANPPAVVASGQPSVATATSATPSDSAPAKKEKIDPFLRLGLDLAERQPAHQRSSFRFEILHPGNPGRCFLYLRFQQTGRQLDRRVERNISL